MVSITVINQSIHSIMTAFPTVVTLMVSGHATWNYCPHCYESTLLTFDIFYLVVRNLGKQNRSMGTGLGINNSVWSNPLVLHFELGEKLIADLKQRIRSILTWCNSLNPGTFSVKTSNGVTLFSHERFLWIFEIKCLPLPFQRREVLNEIDLNWCAPPVRLIPSTWITMNMSLFTFFWTFSKWIPDPRKS